MPHVTHLIDDTTAGGVMRMLEFVQTDPALARLGPHRIVQVTPGRRPPQRFAGDIIVSHQTLSWRRLPWVLALRAAHADRPLIHVEHSYTEAFTALNVRSHRRFQALLRVSYAAFDRVVAVSAAQRAWLTGAGLVTADRLRVIPPAVDLAPFLALAPPAKAPRIIGAIGRLDRQKGFDTLIQAVLATQGPQLALHIFGDGGAGPELKAAAGGAARVVFRGHWADPVAAMASVDAVAMPSRWEAYGLAALEARAAGRPLLVAQVDGLADHAAAGAIAVPAGVASWAAALDRLAQRGAEPGRIAAARQDAAGAAHRFAEAWAALCQEVPQTAAQPA